MKRKRQALSACGFVQCKLQIPKSFSQRLRYLKLLYNMRGLDSVVSAMIRKAIANYSVDELIAPPPPRPSGPEARVRRGAPTKKTHQRVGGESPLLVPYILNPNYLKHLRGDLAHFSFYAFRFLSRYDKALYEICMIMSYMGVVGDHSPLPFPTGATGRCKPVSSRAGSRGATPGS